MVDLLLVRLTREDEKIKVIDLLMTELGMSREEAREKVDSSPNILSEGVEMEQGRILQDRMYPFVDLLPRHYNGNSAIPAAKESEPEKATYDTKTDDFNPPEEQLEEEHPEPEESDDFYFDTGSATQEDVNLNDIEDDEDDSLIITSASEEMLNVERCHICGRTPTGGFKLAPCQVCAELTCSDCYNRKHHVCEKCATDGKTVDRPLDSVPESKQDTGQSSKKVTDSPRRASKPAKTGKSFSIPPIAIILTVLVLVVGFLVIDPMNLLSSSDDTTEIEYGSTDSTEVNTIDVPDTTHVVAIDTIITPVDSLPADTLPPSDYLSLTDISLPDSLIVTEEYSLPRIITSSPINSITILIDSLPAIAEILGQLASVYSIEFDGISLVRTDDGLEILLMSILHPEPAERRAALLGYLGTMLDSTVVDQMVLYYRENQYYNAVLFTFTADSFSVLAGYNSPNILQRKQAFLPETTELITGRIFDWMTDLN